MKLFRSLTNAAFVTFAVSIIAGALEAHAQNLDLENLCQGYDITECNSTSIDTALNNARLSCTTIGGQVGFIVVPPFPNLITGTYCATVTCFPPCVIDFLNGHDWVRMLAE